MKDSFGGTVIEVRVGDDIFWIEEPRPDVNLRDMRDGFETFYRRIGEASYGSRRVWDTSRSKAIISAFQRVLDELPPPINEHYRKDGWDHKVRMEPE